MAPRTPNAIDFWRGFALVSIFINHIPGIYFDRFTHRNLSLSDSAELFVFLAGWSMRYFVGAPDDRRRLTGEIVYRLSSRALTLYAAHMLIVLLAIAMLAFASRALDNALLLEWNNAATVFANPVDGSIGLVLLSHQLGYFDILPLYVCLLLVSPVMVLLHRWTPALLLPASMAVYLAALSFQLAVPTWPSEGQWFFNPFCWQAVFVLGFVLAGDQGLGGFARRHIGAIRMLAVPVVAAGAVMVWFHWGPDPTSVPEPKLLFIADKSFITPMRLLQFLALVAAFSLVYRQIESLLPALVRFCTLLGRNSLPVFCVGSLLSLAAQIVRFEVRGGVVLDLAIVGAGLVILGVTAWLSEWQPRK
jgi:hypothetical protein